MSARNAEPETVALAVLDACERAVRGTSPDYDDVMDTDAQFMKRSVENIRSRIRTLKWQAAALWKPEFAAMLECCHSIAVEEIDSSEKEGVRTEKMKCMACGRYEHSCKFALSGVGPFAGDLFNRSDVNLLQDSWESFYDKYCKLCADDYVTHTKKGTLPTEDMGEYTIGTTCLRKAELYYMLNTFLMECAYEANQAVNERSTGCAQEAKQWFYALEKEADNFVEKLEGIELAIADERRYIPDWGTDPVLWANIEKARSKAAGGLDEKRVELLRERADLMLAGEQGSEDEAVESEDGDEACWRAPRGARRARVVIEDDDDDVPFTGCHSPQRAVRPSKEKRKRKPSAAPTRQSRRMQKLAPEFVEGPREEGVDDESDSEDAPEPEAPRPATRAPPPTAYELAQAQRVPGGRLPARRRALYNLGTLQLKLMADGRDADAAIATNAMFVMQELLARVEQLAHTAEQ